MGFEKEKKDFLDKADKSRKKGIDRKIAKLVNHINSLDNYYTSSSCSGRIVLIEKELGEKKSAKIIFASHDAANHDNIKSHLKKIDKKPIWFKQESAILHICCKSVEDARMLIQAARDSGLKRAGIISIGHKIIVEIIGTENIETIVADKGSMLVEDSYLKRLASEGNKKLESNLKTLARFYNSLKKGI